MDGLAAAWSALAAIESQRDRPSAALHAAEAALASRRRLIEISEDLAFDHTTLATAAVLVGELRSGIGDAEGAREALAEARGTLESLHGMAVEEPGVLEELDATRGRVEELARHLGS